MGHFISISGIVGAQHENVISALSAYVAEKSGVFEPERDTISQRELLSVCSIHGNVSLYFPDWDITWTEASQAISQKLQRAVFAFDIYDDDYWSYKLFQNGIEVDRFAPIPDYFEKVTEEQRNAVKGNADIVCQCVPGLRREQIEKYLVTWNRDALEPQKAYPDDEFPIGDFWQMVDFMRRINFPYDPPKEAVISNFCYKIPQTRNR